MFSLSTIALASITAVSVLAAPPLPATITTLPDSKPTIRAATASPLTDYVYSAVSDIPYQVNPIFSGRGPQSGYNICNATTAGPNSGCQTLYVNTIKDFCLWGSPGLNATGTIGDVEAAVVAYCTDNSHGTRVIAGGSLTAVQFMRTSAYIQVTGLFNQAGINLDPTDGGGELDPHGADLAGNPLGGLVWSSSLPSGNNNTLINSNSWTNFVGGNQFCFKVCDPKITSPNYCENRYDLLGCAYNMPASYAPNEFLSCEGDLQDVVGTYTSGGQTLTWSQPSSLPAGSVLPWTPRIPASSKCVTYQSSNLYAAASTTSSSSSAVATPNSTASGTGAGRLTPSGNTAASTGSNTASNSAQPNATSNKSGAGKRVVASGIAMMGLLVVLVSLI